MKLRKPFDMAEHERRANLPMQQRTAEIYEEFEQYFNAGDPSALLDAIGYSLNSGIAAPRWVSIEFNKAWEIHYESGKVRTLDQAFNIKRPKGWDRRTAKKTPYLGLAHIRVYQYLQNDPAANVRQTAELVAEQLNLELAEHDLKFHWKYLTPIVNAVLEKNPSLGQREP